MTRFGLLKAIGGPGSFGFLVFFGLIGGLMLRYRRTRRPGRWLLMLLGTGYVLLSVPAIALWIAGATPATPVQQFSEFGELDDIYVIGGDNYLARATTAVRLNSVARSRRVWVVGGNELRDALLASGLPEDLWHWGKGSAPTTHDQMHWMMTSMGENGSRGAAVIVSRLQARRVRGLVQGTNQRIVVIAAPVDREPASEGVWRWIPSLAALALSRDAVYERVAYAFYLKNGWI